MKDSATMLKIGGTNLRCRIFRLAKAIRNSQHGGQNPSRGGSRNEIEKVTNRLARPLFKFREKRCGNNAADTPAVDG
ncbi:hypothetical protein SDC9_126698 [bioreactor metagenome]|uniref:Uncharacterized protein n=1 Tax=bioreactor metagenome TaxID=1076179 RepID=A0A645CRY3_9ZZZZ